MSTPTYQSESQAGATKGKIRNLAGTVTAIKSGPGLLTGIQVANNQGAAAWIQVFDAAPGNVTLGTTTPDFEFQVPANTPLFPLLPLAGIPFDTAISIASTTGEAGGTGSSTGVQVFWQTK